ncbi:LIM domain only protein 7 isoform X3, partial [Lates japonicus]
MDCFASSLQRQIPVPSITPSSSRWSWDPEEERRRQEKWQKEQERLLQEKYKRDQEKLQEEWLKAQQDIAKSVDQQEPGNLEVNSHSISPHSPFIPVNQPTSTLWEEEERKRKEEQERQRQAEEKRKREEEERELQRLQEERKRKERQEEEERKRREEEELRWQRRREEEREEERRRQEAAEQQRRERERAFQQQQQQQQWAGGSYGFANVQPPLSFTDRAKSKSSPQLDEEEKPQRKGVYVQPGGMAHWLLEEKLRSARDKEAQSQRAASELEMERRNILNAMRYREPERVTGGGLDEEGAPIQPRRRQGERHATHAQRRVSRQPGFLLQLLMALVMDTREATSSKNYTGLSASLAALPLHGGGSGPSGRFAILPSSTPWAPSEAGRNLVPWSVRLLLPHPLFSNASTVSLTSEIGKLGLRSEYETNSS